MKRLFLYIICSLAPQTAYSTHDVRYITPPKLDQSHLGTKIVCYRPMRNDSPRLSLERGEFATIIHNYGHGGSGWSLGPASAKYSCDLLSKEISAFDRATPIAIIGGGCIGLFTAYHLINEKFTNITLYSSSFDNLTSHHAGGLLSLRSTNPDSETAKLLQAFAIDSYIFYKDIAKNTHPIFTSGASLLPTYMKNYADSEFESLVGIVMEPAKDVLLDFGNGVIRKMIAYDDSIFIDTSLMMDNLHKFLEDKITFKQRFVTQFSDLEEPIIFNCTGLGSKLLANDNQLTGVQGHLIMLTDQNPSDLAYMMITDFAAAQTSKGEIVYRSLDLFPKHLSNSNKHDVGVLGGTFIEEGDESNLHLEEFDLILERANHFYYSKETN